MYVRSILLLLLLFVTPRYSFGQQATVATASRVSCAASGGSSTVAMNARSGRQSFTLQNKAGKDVRISFVSGTPTLSTSNSFTLVSGGNYFESQPGVYVGRVLCQSSDASTADIDISESYR